jgi:dolichol-phosphate mannosyltransferase
MKKDFSDTTIILPTLNEIGNIGKITDMLARRYKNVNMVIVDDGSDDGTLIAARGISGKNPRVRLLDRTEEDLHAHTASVVDAALLVRTPKTVVMDADLQHPVDKVGELVEGLDENDLVIGVRTKVRDWGFGRRAVSAVAGNLAALVFIGRGRRTCSDMMSGLFAIRTDLFKKMIKKNKQGFLMPGCKILLDILKLSDGNTRIMQVPYATFHDRERGGSKLTSRRMFYTLEDILR